MDAFYSDIVYYTRKVWCLSSVFFILGNFFSFFAQKSFFFIQYIKDNRIYGV